MKRLVLLSGAMLVMSCVADEPVDPAANGGVCEADSTTQSFGDPFGKGDEVSTAQRNCDVAPEIDFVALQSGADVTGARVESLNAYAASKLTSMQCDLDAKLVRKGVDVASTPPLYSLYGIEVGSPDGCLNGGFLLADFDLNSEGKYSDMKRQIDMTAQFLADMYVDTNGNGSILFDSVELCPKQEVGGRLAMQGPTLLVGLTFSQFFDEIKLLNALELRRLWSRGEHLSELPQGTKLRLLWPLLDPAGTARLAITRAVADGAQYLAEALTMLRDSGGDEDFQRSELRSLVSDNVAPDTTDASGNPIAERALGVIDALSPIEIECIADAWSDEVLDSSRWDAVGEAAVSTTIEQQKANQVNATIHQEGFIVVGNAHFIDVDVSLYVSAAHRPFTNYVTVHEVEQNLNVTQKGFVVVYTIDSVEVNLNVSVDRTLETFSLEKALSRCGL